ncbi:MAG TPA: tRNA 4-thiouridine(8) synthase ThiI [Lachnospiraceae bacterium]|nr:tRNA 4-thiouridine(8) synthase ThiI [Lachnospiraceae bacterium]
MANTYLIKYAEIGIKGKNRYKFEDALVHRIIERVRRVDGEFRVQKEQGRITVEALSEHDEEELITALSHVFGVAQICPVTESRDKDFQSILEALYEHIEGRMKDKAFTFKVFAKRSDKSYPMESPEICVEAGSYILDKFPNASVDVHSPEYKIFIEVRRQAYVYMSGYPGAGGMPVGTAGKAMLLLSGGIDSPVAGYRIAKRGVQIEAVYFHAPPYTSDRAKQKVVDLARIISEYTGPIHMYVVNFTDIQLDIYEKCPHDELTIIMRRYMMRIAEHLARQDECLGLVTGESIAQVASQTMQSLAATDAVCGMPVYRPLIAMDKQEIIKESMDIGAYETSILPYEDCCTIFVAKHPVTKPKTKDIEVSEELLKGSIEELVEKAIHTAEAMWISAN